MGVRTVSLIAVAVAGITAVVQAGSPGAGTAARTQITIWATPAPPSGEAYGGLAYGGYAPTTGALITEQRELDVGGDTRVAGVAATLDPASVQLRDLTDPAAEISDQRFAPAAATPTEILARHVGDAVSVTTPKGEVAGVLRAVDDQVIVVETGAGDQRRLQVMRRDSYVQDIRLPASAGGDPSLAWRVRSARPGKHTVELSYRADGMWWTADYLAVLDEPGRAVELSSWATIKNATGASYDGVDLILVGAAPDAPPSGVGRAPPARFHVPAPVRIGRGDAVQVELAPRRTAPVRSVVIYEAMPDPSPRFQAAPGIECNQFSAAAPGGHGDVAIELDVPARTTLPDGKVRLFQRRAGRLDVVTEEPLRTGAGVARIRIAPAADITGERRGVTCSADEQHHTVRETVEVKLENHGRQPADVVLREFLWRWPVWHIEAEDRKGVRAGPQLQEYRMRVPAMGKQVVTYTAVYAW